MFLDFFFFRLANVCCHGTDTDTGMERTRAWKTLGNHVLSCEECQHNSTLGKRIICHQPRCISSSPLAMNLSKQITSHI